MSEEAINTEASQIKENCCTTRSSHCKPISELKDELQSKSMCGVSAIVEKHHVTDDVHIASIENSNSEQENANMDVPVALDYSNNGRSMDPTNTSELEGGFILNSNNGYTVEEKERHEAVENQPKESSEQLRHLSKDALLNEGDNWVGSQAESQNTKDEVVGIETVGGAEESGTSKSDFKSLEVVGLPLEDVPINSCGEQIGSSSQNVILDRLGHVEEEASRNASQMGHNDKKTSMQRKKKDKRNLVGSMRVLRSMKEEISKEPAMKNSVAPNNNLAENSSDQNKKRKRMKKEKKNLPVNEFSRIRNHLRYILHRIKYEENLIDAYSGEGWKGQSLEKIKPEKELERAKSEIFRCKLKIRELFQRLDLSCAKGKLPECLFDSEGEIDHEDIFCSKCGSKELELDNDIILCDGACERGFHQFCLEPPLLKIDIPPDDEGWLCPGCDCKVDCIDLLNDSQGTELSILDSWEKIYPEVAAAAAAGNILDAGTELPSDDSEDDDYNPDFRGMDEKFQSSESSSDEFASASDYDDLLNPLHEKQDQGLSSDDSEDNDYDPSAPDHDDQVKPESSSSDFTSDSEDLNVALDDDRSSRKSSSDDNASNCTDFGGEKQGTMKKRSLRNEVSYLLKSAPSLLSEKRHVEQLDYKRLYDEAYGGLDSSDSSDEDFNDITASKRRKRSAEKNVILSPKEKSSPVKNGTDGKDMKNCLNKAKRTSRRSHKISDAGGSTASPASSLEPGSSSKHSRYGEVVTQELLKSFKENQYPKRNVKEELSKELGLTAQQVSKWFENARWSFRHPSCVESSAVQKKSIPSPQINKNRSEAVKQTPAKASACNGIKSKRQLRASLTGNLDNNECNAEATPSSNSQRKGRKGRGNSSNLTGSLSESSKALCQSVQADAQCHRQVRRSGRIQTRSGNTAP